MPRQQLQQGIVQFGMRLPQSVYRRAVEHLQCHVVKRFCGMGAWFFVNDAAGAETIAGAEQLV